MNLEMTTRLKTLAAMFCVLMAAAIGLCAYSVNPAYAAGSLSSGTAASKGANVTDQARVQLLFDKSVHSSSGSTAYSSRQYDITGDGYADDLQFNIPKGSYTFNSFKVTVNGKSALNLSKPNGGAYTASAKLVTLKNNKPFLFVKFYGNNGDGIHALYQYKGGTFKKIADQNAFSTKSKQANHRNISDVTVSGNKVTLSYFYMTMFAGGIQIKQAYKYSAKSATLKKSGSSTSSLGYYAMGKSKLGKHKLTAVKSFTVYSSKSLKKAKFKVKKGAKVKIVSALTKGGNLLFKVKSGGKTGWVKSKGITKSKAHPYGGTWFKESMIAG